MSPVIPLASLCLAATAIPGLAQTGRAERDVLDVIVSYANPPSEIGRYPSDVREELERYLQRVRDYRPRPRPPGLGSETTTVYAAREEYEGKLVAAATPGVERFAQEYVDSLRPCIEWEGFHDCPEREAIFAERYLLAHPASPFAAFFACSQPIDGSARPRHTNTSGNRQAPREPAPNIKTRWRQRSMSSPG